MQYAHMLYDEVQALNLDLADSTNIHNPFTAEDGAMSDFHFFLGKCFGAAQVSGTEALDPLIDPDMVLRLAQSYEFIAASENNTAFGEGYLEGGEHVKDLFGVAHTSDEDKPDEWSLSDFWIPNKKPHAVNRN